MRGEGNKADISEDRSVKTFFFAIAKIKRILHRSSKSEVIFDI